MRFLDEQETDERKESARCGEEQAKLQIGAKQGHVELLRLIAVPLGKNLGPGR